MIDLQSRLDALPDWPTRSTFVGRGVELEAALARLALWHELAQAGDERLTNHTRKCVLWDRTRLCTCGRDLLLKKLEVPRG